MTMNVKLIPLPGDRWQVSHGGKTGDQPGNYPRVKLDKESGPYIITFDIVGNDPVTFAPESQVLGVKAGGKPAPQETHPQIPVWVVSHGGKKLTLFDRNDNYNPGQQPLELHYRLKFNGHGELDPIIDNGGTGNQPAPPAPPPPPRTEGANETGSTTAPSSQGAGLLGGFDAIAFLIGLVVGLLLALLWCKWGR